MPWEWKSLVDNLLATFGTALAALLIPLLAAKYVLPHLPKGARVISEETLAGARAAAPAAARLAPGAQGVAKTPLRPSGKALFGAETVEVSSRGEFIEAGMPLEVSRIDGNRIVVRASAQADETGGREAGA